MIVHGTLLVSKSIEAVPFAVIYDSISGRGTTSDLNGRFELQVPRNSGEFRISCSGFETRYYFFQKSTDTIYLSPKTQVLNEVVITPGENPANRIIKAASANRRMHNPSRLDSWSCVSYTKTFATTADLHDTTLRLRNAVDSLLDRQYLFLSESVSEIKYRSPGLKQETILASKVSGLEQPTVTLLATQLQSFSFYNDVFEVLDRQYVNPLTPEALIRYRFYLKETIIEPEGDTTFIIVFRPKKAFEENSLQGEMHISSDGYAIRNVTAEPAENKGSLSIQILQHYEKTDSIHWFPVQLHTEWYNNILVVNDSNIIINRKQGIRQDSTLRRTKAVCKTYLSHIKIGQPYHLREFGTTELQIGEMSEQPDSMLQQYRVVNLNEKEKRTYRTIDSIGTKYNLDYKINFVTAVARGKLPLGFIEADLNRFIEYNNYEGFRLGAGIHTSNKFSRRFKAGGYVAYGLRDQQIKYGADASYLIHEKSLLRVYIRHSDDVAESGAIHGRLDDPLKISEFYRRLFRQKFDRTRQEEAGFKFRVYRNILLDFYIRKDFRTISDEYRYVLHAEGAEVYLKQFEFTEAGGAIRLAFQEKYAMLMGERTLIKASLWPLIFGEVAYSLQYWDYVRTGLRIQYNGPQTIGGQPSFVILAGKVWGDVPYTHLFAGRGTYGRYAVSCRNTFETMKINEFICDQYACLFYAHSFSIHAGKKWNPEIVLRTSAGFGTLAKPENHIGRSSKSMDKGYYESGIELNRLLHFGIGNLGISAFLRHGPYAKSAAGDNLAVKFTLFIGL
ncbi:MAG: DUF5686 family protein [Bacteroidia bacterium]